MKPATEMRGGMIIDVDSELYRVIQSDYHGGVGKLQGVVRAKLRSLRTGHVTEKRFRQDERFVEVALDRETMEFIYEDGDHCTFMHPQSYEQMSISKERLGPFLRFLKPNQSIQIGIFQGSPVEVIYPATVDVLVESTAEPVHAQHDSNVFKTAALENGMEVLVPQFIKTGDIVRIDVDTGKYVERVK